jgi:hypothetical protein
MLVYLYRNYLKKKVMTITVKINTDTPAGKRLENELRRYPETVEFITSSVVSDILPEGYVSLKDGFDQVREHVKSLYKNDASAK